jgi:tRNA-splicing ligase RtcB (3'-phosphate/5'-hydroxy nucleic acid ligase)
MDIKNNLKKISEVEWEIPAAYRNDMRVPARIYATEEMLKDIVNDRSLNQLVNVSTLPGIQKAAMVMPDVHEGYGFPIGGVAATKYPDGVISPGGIGYDINCGVRLLKSEHTVKEIHDYIEPLSKEIYKLVPSGVGKSGFLKLSSGELDKVLTSGVSWAIDNGYGEENDCEYIESNGTIPNANSDKVSIHAKERGADQLGTMGAGNHFVEIDKVSKIFDEDAAMSYGLFLNQVVFLIHTGSRGLGHQVATDYIRIMLNAMPHYGITLPDRELACVPFSSPEGKDYFGAMSAAANFAFTNRQLITWELRQAWENILGKKSGVLKIVYDVAHNIAKIEEHIIDERKLKVIVHRKGATRAFGPEFDELPDEYKSSGQPVLIPGSMGTSSFVLAGTHKSMEESFGSTCHGAGRAMSRHAARKKVRGEKLREDLLGKGIIVQAGSIRGIAEEAPIAYKDVQSVVDVVDRAGIAKKVAELKPMAVIKG